MPSLFIDRRTTQLKLDGEVLICYENEERIATIPLAPIERLYMKGDIALQASLLAKLGEKGIGVVFLQGRKNMPMLFLSQPHNDAQRRVMQYAKSQDAVFCLDWAKYLIRQKIVSQRACLDDIAKNNEKITACIDELVSLMAMIPQQTALASLRGVEGKMGAVYFQALKQLLPAELGFEGRNRRPPKDPFNAALSFGYTILYSEASLALYSAGLDPFVGFFHELHFGRKSLACDIMEPLRPQFDRWLIDCFLQGILKVEHFSQTNEGCILTKEGRVIFYTEFEKRATTWRKTLENQSYTLANLITDKADWEDMCVI